MHDLGEKLIVGIDLEVDGNMELAAAHEVTRVLERNIREDFGEDVEVDTHIEPLEPELPHGTDAAPERVETIQGRADATMPATARSMTFTMCGCATLTRAKSLTSIAAPRRR